ncbi:MAG: hypothetical protein ACOYOV_10470 [Bacteroidales bacterium]
MSIFTQTTNPEFFKQSISEYFVDPMFMAEDIRGAVTVRTDIKGTEKLNKISRPSMITKPKVAAGFNPTGTFTLTYQDITVKPMAIEFQQNGRDFWGAIVQQLLATGYKEDDVEQMKNPDIWNKIMLPIIAQAGQNDLVRQMFFADPDHEALVTSKPNGAIDDNYSGYTGFMTHFLKDIANGTIPASQHVKIQTATSAVKKEQIITYTAGTDTKIGVTVNGVLYEQAFATNANTTIANWLATHKTTIEARAGINGVIVTNPSGAQIKVVSKYAGQDFALTNSVTGTGTFASSGLITAVKPGSLAVDETDATLEAMIDNMLPELTEFNPVFMLTRSMYRNLVHTFKKRGTDLADSVMLNGFKVPSYEGIPILIRPDWDIWIASSFNGLLPHRAILTTQKNLLFGTDGTSDSEMIETWYNPDIQQRRYRVQYKAQTAYFHKELIVLAGFED